MLGETRGAYMVSSVLPAINIFYLNLEESIEHGFCGKHGRDRQRITRRECPSSLSRAILKNFSSRYVHKTVKRIKGTLSVKPNKI